MISAILQSSSDPSSGLITDNCSEMREKESRLGASKGVEGKGRGRRTSKILRQ